MSREQSVIQAKFLEYSSTVQYLHNNDWKNSDEGITRKNKVF